MKDEYYIITFLWISFRYVYGANTTLVHTTVQTTTTRHHGNHHQPTHSSEKLEHDSIVFHYDGNAIEKLLVAKNDKICYAFPLSDDETEDVHDVHKLIQLEAHLLHQIQIRAYTLWSVDDLSVRSQFFSSFCPEGSTVYRVFRL